MSSIYVHCVHSSVRFHVCMQYSGMNSSYVNCEGELYAYEHPISECHVCQRHINPSKCVRGE